MVDLEPYVGEVVMILLSRPVPYVVKNGMQFQPMMIPPQKEGDAPMPAITDMLQGRIDKREKNYVMTYVNPVNKSTRMSIAIDPKLVDAVFSHSNIVVATPGEILAPES
jgi:hypothetical protein